MLVANVDTHHHYVLPPLPNANHCQPTTSTSTSTSININISFATITISFTVTSGNGVIERHEFVGLHRFVVLITTLEAAAKQDVRKAPASEGAMEKLKDEMQETERKLLDLDNEVAALLDSVDHQETRYSQLTSDINHAQQSQEVVVLPDKVLKKALRVKEAETVDLDDLVGFGRNDSIATYLSDSEPNTPNPTPPPARPPRDGGASWQRPAVAAAPARRHSGVRDPVGRPPTLPPPHAIQPALRPVGVSLRCLRALPAMPRLPYMPQPRPRPS